MACEDKLKIIKSMSSAFNKHIGDASSGAVFSADDRYRYLLYRSWSNNPSVNFVMLNPSTADEIDNDPTVERCQRRADAMGFGGLIVTNIFAFRATDPKEMKAESCPIGEENDAWLLAAASWCDMIVCAWGSHGSHKGRSASVKQLLKSNYPDKLHYLRLTQRGQPQHPLYIPYTSLPVKWR